MTWNYQPTTSRGDTSVDYAPTRFAGQRFLSGGYSSLPAASASGGASRWKSSLDATTGQWMNASNAVGSAYNTDVAGQYSLASQAINGAWGAKGQELYGDAMAEAQKASKPSTFGSILGGGLALASAFIPRPV